MVNFSPGTGRKGGPGTSGMAMTKADLERYRSTLVALRARLTGDVSHLADEAFRARGAKDGPSVAPAADLADQGADSYDHEFTLSLLQNQEQTLEEIDDALERVRQGRFGRCEECGGAIARARLQALPYTRHCVSCARRLQ
jgi:RNA polymerase-binding transcription factor DksA